MRLTNITETRDEYLAVEVAAAARKFVTEVLDLQAGTDVLITTDSRTDLRVARAIAGAVAGAGATPLMLHVPAPDRSYADPPAAVGAAAAACGIWVACAWNEVIYSPGWRAAVDRGVQYVSYGGLDADGFVRCVGRVDTPRLQRMGDRIVELLTDAEMRVTSAAGTDIVFHNRGGTVGAFRMVANAEAIPVMLAGQVTWEPDEASMTGVLVADGILSPPEEVGLIREPLRIEVDAGRILSIEGGREALLLERWLRQRGDATLRRIAHASLGFNPGVTVPTGRILEDERAFGDIDFGWGAWVNRPAAGHFDFTCRQVTIEADGAEVLREGLFTDPVLASLCRDMGLPGH